MNTMKKEVFIRILAVWGLAVPALLPVFGQYATVNIDAPFPMEPIKEFIFPKKDFSIVQYGAVKGGKVCNTDAIAKTIDVCNRAGGGRVLVPEGEWLTGPIHLKSNVKLYLAENAVLRFTDNPSDYLPSVMTSWEGMECYSNILTFKSIN